MEGKCFCFTNLVSTLRDKIDIHLISGVINSAIRDWMCNFFDDYEDDCPQGVKGTLDFKDYAYDCYFEDDIPNVITDEHYITLINYINKELGISLNNKDPFYYKCANDVLWAIIEMVICDNLTLEVPYTNVEKCNVKRKNSAETCNHT